MDGLKPRVEKVVGEWCVIRNGIAHWRVPTWETAIWLALDYANRPFRTCYTGELRRRHE